MSFSDWDQNTSFNFSNLPTLNSSLANSLAIGGAYCRYLYAQGSGYSRMVYLAKTTYSGGAFYNMPNTTALRLQGYFRGSILQNFAGSQVFLGLGAKTSDTLGQSGGLVPNGYALGLGNAGTIQLWLNTGPVTLATGGLNTWYGLRLEVFPIGTSGDRIKAYIESSPGSGNWGTAVYDQTIENTSANYVPWGGNRRCGFGARSFYLNGSADSNITQGYVDLVTFSAATAPTPIP